ncbi:MAG: D-alanyl-D-alanine carboxypeptidase family protein [Alicyclobacillaceae bacterium]|nr:D-alanyl-D-alanine carboxypeptidase family protein [Alicyclobacillaceae bacterium]
MHVMRTKPTVLGRIVLIVFLLLLTGVPPGPARAQDLGPDEGPPDLAVQSAVLMDMKTGQVLYAKNPDARHYPASITKILTAILALEHGSLDDRITASRLATEQEGNRVYLVEGEVHTLEELLYGLMLNSGNDAAVAIAEHYGGSVAGFAAMMNAKAAEIGAKNSHFVNPNGLHDPDHYTTAYDMCLIGRYAMQNPIFRRIVATKTYPWHGREWDTVLVNINRMLWTYPGATGVKTGYTDQAQQTMVVTAEREGQSFIACLMDIPGQEAMRLEATKLLDYGFRHFRTEQIASAGTAVQTVRLPGNQLAQALLSRSVWYSFASGQIPQVTADVQLAPPPLPIQRGTPIGTVTYSVDGQVIAQVPLVSDRAVEAPPDRWRWLLLTSPAFLLYVIWRRKRRRRFRNAARPQWRQF